MIIKLEEVMLRKGLLVLSAILILIWAVGMYVFHNTLGGYLHLFLLLAANSALFCIAREEKKKDKARELDYVPKQPEWNKH